MKSTRLGAFVFLLAVLALPSASLALSLSSDPAAWGFPTSTADSADGRVHVEAVRVNASSVAKYLEAIADRPEDEVDSGEDDLEALEEEESPPEIDPLEALPAYLVVSVYSVLPGMEPVRTSMFRLPNAELPRRILVSNDGLSVIFLRAAENLYRASPAASGAEHGLVTLYRPDGSRVRTLRLEDLLTPIDIRESQFLSMRELPWAATEIDESRNALELRLDRRLPEESPVEDRLAVLRIDLDTGLPLQRKRALVARPRAILVRLQDEASYLADSAVRGNTECLPSPAHPIATGLLRPVSNEELRAHALAAPLPIYSELGRKARVSGTVVVEVRISTTGEVTSACLAKSLPLGLGKNALAAVQAWRFRAFEIEGQPASVVGYLSFEFGRFLPGKAPGELVTAASRKPSPAH